MERIYCEYYCLWKSGTETDDYDIDATSAECTYRICYYNNCIFKLPDREEMKKEGVYCPFWEISGGWMDIRELEYQGIV